MESETKDLINTKLSQAIKDIQSVRAEAGLGPLYLDEGYVCIDESGGVNYFNEQPILTQPSVGSSYWEYSGAKKRGNFFHGIKYLLCVLPMKDISFYQVYDVEEGRIR